MLTQSAVAETPQHHFQSPFVPGRKPASSESMPPVGLVMNFGRNAEIYAEGETSGYVYKVLSGVVRVSKLLPDGRRQISAFHMPGEMFGFEAGEIHYASAEAVTPAKLVAFKWAGLLDVSSKQIGVVRELLSLAVMGLRRSQDHLLLLGRKNALERLAAFLLQMDARSGSNHIVDLAMPRHDIADYLGLTLETVSRMFAELKEAGVIELESARRVHLLNVTKLKAMSV
jgi:CRP/FNR family transcriptional regulator, nitrogen fixation regulation protein